MNFLPWIERLKPARAALLNVALGYFWVNFRRFGNTGK
jgi:hypothetical protein